MKNCILCDHLFQINKKFDDCKAVYRCTLRNVIIINPDTQLDCEDFKKEGEKEIAKSKA